MKSKAATRIYLGTVTEDDKVFSFTELGTFRTVAAANVKWHERPRNGLAVLVKEWDVSINGVVYGIHKEVWSLDGSVRIL